MEHVQELSLSECLRLLAGRSLGRVAYTERALPAIRAVSYALVGTHLVLRTDSALAGRLTGQVVAFEVDDADEHPEAAWGVAVTGTARLLRAPSELIRLDAALPLAAWAEPEHISTVQITPGDVRGRRILRTPATVT